MLSLAHLALMGSLEDVGKALIEVCTVCWHVFGVLVALDNSGEALWHAGEKNVAQDPVWDRRGLAEGDEVAAETEKLEAERIDGVLAGPAKTAELGLEEALAGEAAPLVTRDECSPGQKSSALGDLSDDTDGVVSKVEADLRVGAGVVGGMSGVHVVLDAADEVQAAEVHAHDEAPLAEGLWLTREDGDGGPWLGNGVSHSRSGM
jgi:hypothetical protein